MQLSSCVVVKGEVLHSIALELSFVKGKKRMIQNAENAFGVCGNTAARRGDHDIDSSKKTKPERHTFCRYSSDQPHCTWQMRGTYQGNSKQIKVAW